MNAAGGFFIMIGMFFLGHDICLAARTLAAAIRERR